MPFPTPFAAEAAPPAFAAAFACPRNGSDGVTRGWGANGQCVRAEGGEGRGARVDSIGGSTETPSDMCRRHGECTCSADAADAAICRGRAWGGGAAGWGWKTGVMSGRCGACVVGGCEWAEGRLADVRDPKSPKPHPERRMAKRGENMQP
eukprot:1645052-Prymnesium_polylepis.1